MEAIDILNMNMTEIIQQSATIIAKQTKKQKKPRISSPTRAILKKRREMIQNNTPRDQIDRICRDLYDHKEESEGRHPETQPT